MLEEMYKWSAEKCDLNHSLSETIQCKVGVKQGYVLSPTLFNLCVNDLPDELTGVSNSLDTPNLYISFSYFCLSVCLCVCPSKTR